MEKTKQPHCDTHTHFEYDCIDCDDARKAAHVPGSDLTTKQAKAAHNLRVSRPMTIPGTNAIIVKAEATEWHDRVASVAIAAKVQPAQEKAFFDACGVAE